MSDLTAIDDWVDAKAFVDLLYDDLTDMEAAVCTFLQYSYSAREIADHFELQYYKVLGHIRAVRNKARRLAEQDDWRHLMNDEMRFVL